MNGLRLRLEDCCQRLTLQIADTLYNEFSTILADICLDIPKQCYLLTYYTDQNAERRHNLFFALKQLIRCALDLDDAERETNVDDETYKQYVRVAESHVSAGMFNGPSNTILDSWVSIPSDKLLEERLFNSLKYQFDNAVPERQWLSHMLEDVNRIFMTSCFGVQSKETSNQYRFCLLPYITIRPPFYLPFSGTVMHNLENPQPCDVQPCPVSHPHVFIQAQVEDFLMYLPSEPVDQSLSFGFTFSNDRPGLINLTNEISSTDNLLELCLYCVMSQPSVSVVRSNKIIPYINLEQGREICSSICDIGYACVDFLPSFRDEVCLMLDDKSIHQLAAGAVTHANRIAGTDSRHYFKYERLFSSTDNSSHELLKNLIDGPLKQACSQLRSCIDSNTQSEYQHSLIWEQGTVGLLSGPGEKEQKAHIDVPGQCMQCLVFHNVCWSTLTVVGM